MNDSVSKDRFDAVCTWTEKTSTVIRYIATSAAASLAVSTAIFLEFGGDIIPPVRWLILAAWASVLLSLALSAWALWMVHAWNDRFARLYWSDWMDRVGLPTGTLDEAIRYGKKITPVALVALSFLAMGFCLLTAAVVITFLR